MDEQKVPFTTYAWLGVTSLGILAVLAVPVVLAFSHTNAAVLSPVADESITPSSPTAPAVQSAGVVYSPTQYIYLSQSFFSDGQTLSQNRQQSQEDKKVILTKLQQSLDTISEGVSLYPKRPELWAHRAAIKRALAGLSANAIPSAIADMNEAVTLAPANPDYTKTLSDLYLKQCAAVHPEGERSSHLPGEACQLDKAVSYLARTQAAKPNDAQLLYSLAQLQVKAGLLKNAQISFAKLLALVADANQKQKIQSEKAAVEALLAKAGGDANSSTPGVEDFNTPGVSLGDDSPPAGLELVPDQQVMSRELVVASPDDGLSPYEDAVGGSAFSGTATLAAGATSVTVESTRVTDTAPVYVTLATPGVKDFNTPGVNATLTVTTKKAGSHFVVSIDAAQTSDIPFNWWILE